MKCDQKVINRVKRTIGQLNGVLDMIGQERDCKEIVTQLSASKSNLDRTISLITTQNLLNKIRENYDIDEQSIINELDLIVKTK